MGKKATEGESPYQKIQVFLRSLHKRQHRAKKCIMWGGRERNNVRKGRERKRGKGVGERGNTRKKKEIDS